MKKMTKIGIVVLALMMVLTAAACLRPRARLQENIAENIIEKNLEAQGVDADVDINGDEFSMTSEEGDFTVSQNSKWPSSAPADIPEFKGGNLTATVEMETQVMLNFEEVKEQEVRDYAAALEKAGFSQTMKNEMDDGLFYVFEKGSMQLTVGYQDQTMSIIWNIGD